MESSLRSWRCSTCLVSILIYHFNIFCEFSLVSNNLCAPFIYSVVKAHELEMRLVHLTNRPLMELKDNIVG